MAMNSVNIVGNLTRDPELRGLPSGGSVCSLRIACNERYKNNQTGQWDDRANYFNVTVFGNSADATAKFLSKGRQVAISGRLRHREYTDKDGNKREAIEIVANDVQFVGGNPNNQGGGGQQGGGYQAPQGQQGGYQAPQGQQAPTQGYAAPQGQQAPPQQQGHTPYPVDQGNFQGQPQQQGPPAQQGQPQWQDQAGWAGPGAQQQQPAPTPAPADDDIPF